MTPCVRNWNQEGQGLGESDGTEEEEDSFEKCVRHTVYKREACGVRNAKDKSTPPIDNVSLAGSGLLIGGWKWSVLARIPSHLSPHLQPQLLFLLLPLRCVALRCVAGPSPPICLGTYQVGKYQRLDTTILRSYPYLGCSFLLCSAPARILQARSPCPSGGLEDGRRGVRCAAMRCCCVGLPQ